MRFSVFGGMVVSCFMSEVLWGLSPALGRRAGGHCSGSRDAASAEPHLAQGSPYLPSCPVH